MASVTYRCTQAAASTTLPGSLIDGGANGGLAGEDVRVLSYTDRSADITGIGDSHMEDVPIVTCAGVVQTTRGPIVIIMNQYAYYGKGSTMHSIGQLSHFGNTVDDKSAMIPGHQQRMVTVDQWVIPFQCRQGLIRMPMHPPTDEELDTLPTVVFTSDALWEPGVLDHEINVEEDVYHKAMESPEELDEFNSFDPRYNETGHYLHVDCVARVLEAYQARTHPGQPMDTNDKLNATVNPRNRRLNSYDYEKLRPYLLWLPLDRVKKTLENSTQWFRNMYRILFRKLFKSRFPAFNVPRRHEPVATDTMWSKVPAIDGGAKGAPVFVGRTTKFVDVYPVRTDGEFVQTLEDNIRRRGAMDILISDNAKAQISNKVKDILRMYKIADYQSEPHHQHQNFAERTIGFLKDTCNRVLTFTGAPTTLWFLCLSYVATVLNICSLESLDNLSPHQKLTGQWPDISAATCFLFYEPVYYSETGQFPTPQERKGRWVGFADNVGDALTFQILSDDTQRIVHRPAVRSALIESERNRQLDPFEGENSQKAIQEIVHSRDFESDGCPPPPVFSPLDETDLVGRTFLTDPTKDGRRFQATVVSKIQELDNDTQEAREKYLVKVPHIEHDPIMGYQELIDALSTQEINLKEGNTEDLTFWNWKQIQSHEGPLSPTHPSYKGSKYNLVIEWDDGSVTHEPLDTFCKDAPMACATYAKDNGLLSAPGSKRYKRLLEAEERMERSIKKAKHNHNKIKYMYGVRIPRHPAEALRFDEENGSTKWLDSMKLEIQQLMDYQTFIVKGTNVYMPADFTKIRCRMVFAVKHDGRHKSRFVVGGHLTDDPGESVYSGVVSLRSIRLILLIGELNGLQTYQADVGNAYLEAYTKEKVYFEAGPEFRAFGLEGYTMVINKALYGLKTSGKRYNERFADTMRSDGFSPCRADTDVWMRRNGNVYE